MRRRLRDVGKTVSGVLGAVLGEAPVSPRTSAGPAAPVLPQTGGDAGALPPSAPAEQEPLVTETAAPPSTEPAPARTPDPVLAGAVELAREAAVEAGGAAVGEHLGVEVEGGGLQGVQARIVADFVVIIAPRLTVNAELARDFGDFVVVGRN